MTMANRRPTPLKDEPLVPLDELQKQISRLIAVVNSLAERTAAEKHQSDDRLQNAVSMSVVKAVQDLLETRQKKFEEADKGKMTVNEVLQEILDQYKDICGKAKGFYMIYKGADDRFRHIDEKLQKVCNNEKVLYDTMKSILQAQDIKAENEYKCPTIPSGFRNTVRHFAYNLPLYWLKRFYRSHHVRLYVKICLFCIWVITIATAAFIAYDNAVLRQENNKYKILHQYLRENTNLGKGMDCFDIMYQDCMPNK